MHIGKFRLNCAVSGPMQNGGNYSSVSLEPKVDIQLGKSKSEHLVYNESHKSNGYTYTTRLNLTLDLSQPDSTYWLASKSYQHITGGTLYYEEKKDYEETWWDSENERTVVDKYSYIHTHEATIRKNLYSNYDGDTDRGEFRHYWTQIEPDENGEWSEESGVDVRAEEVLKKNGVEQYRSVWDKDPEFELLILSAYD